MVYEEGRKDFIDGKVPGTGLVIATNNFFRYIVLIGFIIIVSMNTKMLCTLRITNGIMVLFKVGRLCNGFFDLLCIVS